MGNAPTRPVPGEWPPVAEIQNEIRLPESPRIAPRATLSYQEDNVADDQSVHSADSTGSSVLDLTPREGSYYWSGSETSPDYRPLILPASKRGRRSSRVRSEYLDKTYQRLNKEHDTSKKAASDQGGTKETLTKEAARLVYSPKVEQASGKGDNFKDAETKEAAAEKKTASRPHMNKSLVQADKTPLKGVIAKARARAGKAAQIQNSNFFLSVLPLEVRLLIYHQLLTTPKTIRGGELVEDKCCSLIIPHDRPAVFSLGIDATILRTCKQVYHEALPLLYQNNTFGFSEVRMIEKFKTQGLRGYTPKFAFQKTVQGRLSLVRHLYLRFGHDPRPTSGRSVDTKYYRDSNQWADFFQECRWSSEHDYTCFPALTHLVLDFSEWKLKDDEGVATIPIVEKLKVERKLEKLTLVGVTHQESIRKLREGLLRKNWTLVLQGRVVGKPF